MISGWIGVDLDNTLAEYHGDVQVIGKPIEPMCERVRKWIALGHDVRIVTARVAGLYLEPSELAEAQLGGMGGPIMSRVLTQGEYELAQFAIEQKRLIERWCEHHLGKRLPVTAVKDYLMIELWDDRAVAVEAGTGKAARYVGGDLVEREG